MVLSSRKKIEQEILENMVAKVIEFEITIAKKKWSCKISLQSICESIVLVFLESSLERRIPLKR